jgi:prepilin-type N-terminal cleavage/methylation domain-containing protein/prepilin-type processing-associated H-X9-DG protein
MIAASKRAFTLIELLVVIAIIAILAAILFPVFAKVREKARQTSCVSNEKQIALGVTQYVQDYDETLPSITMDFNPGGLFVSDRHMWTDAIYPYIKSTGVFRCPSNSKANTPGGPSVPASGSATFAYAAAIYDYGNGGVYSGTTVEQGSFSPDSTIPSALASFTAPSETILLGEPIAQTGYCWYMTAHNYGAGLETPSDIHNGGSNLAFVDGHVKWLNAGRINLNPNTGVADDYLWKRVKP